MGENKEAMGEYLNLRMGEPKVANRCSWGMWQAKLELQSILPILVTGKYKGLMMVTRTGAVLLL